MKNSQKILNLLEERYRYYANPSFIDSDPISIPHQYSRKEDREISGLLTALLSWGRRTAIISSAQRLMGLMENQPHAFVTQAQGADLRRLDGFVYRTFNGDDLLFLMEALRSIYVEAGGLEMVVTSLWNETASIKEVIHGLKNRLLETPHLARSEKHLADPLKGSAAKRINMYLRWMIRTNREGVDFGLWSAIPQSALQCPLDVHSGTVARNLGILQRRQNDWKAVEELTGVLSSFDPSDPVKYDYALFGMGAGGFEV